MSAVGASGTVARVPTESRAAPSAGVGLRAWISLDLRTARRAFPFGQLVLPLAAVVVAAAVGWLRPGYFSIYSESLVVIAGLFAFGAFGRLTGVLAALAFAVADLAHFLAIPDNTIGAQVSRSTTIGRVVTEAVFWLAIVVVPTAARRFETLSERRAGSAATGRLVGAVFGGAAAGVGMYLWANVMPYLVRPAYAYSPPPFTLVPQQKPELLALAAGAIYFAVSLVLRRRVVEPAEIGPWISGRRLSWPLALLGRIVMYALVLALLLGIETATSDMVILAAGFAAAEVLTWLAGRTAVARRVAAIPRSALAMGAFAVTLVVAVVVGTVANQAWPKGLGDSLFLPIVVALAVAIPVGRVGYVLAAAGRAGGLRGAAIAPATLSTIVLVVTAVVAVIVLAVPMTALADNCSGLGDCGFSQRFLLVISGFAAFFGAGAGAASGGGGDGGDGGGGGGSGGHGPKDQPKPQNPPPPTEDY